MNYSFADDFRAHRPVYLGILIALCVWCAVDVQKRGVIDPARPDRHMTDFTVYTEAGSAFFDGREPYSVVNIRGWSYLYPPLFALMMAPLAPLHPQVQVAVFFFLSVAMCLGCYVECRKLTAAIIAQVGSASPAAERRAQVLRDALGWVALCAALACLFPTMNCLQRGQIGVAKLYPLLLGFRWLAVGRTPWEWWCGGLVLALPIALKLTPALPVACLLFLYAGAAVTRAAQRQAAEMPRAAARCLMGGGGVVLGCALFFLLIPAAVVGWDANLKHLETWHRKVASKVSDVRSEDFGGDVVSMRNQSLANAAYRGGNWLAHLAGGPDDRLVDDGATRSSHMPMDAPWLNQALTGLRCLVVLILGLTLVQLGRNGDLGSLASGFGLACAATLIVSPVSRGHYFLLLLPAAVFVPLWLLERGENRAARWVAIVPAVLTVGHYLALNQLGRVGWLGLGCTFWFLLTLAAVARRSNAASPAVEAAPSSHLVQAA